MKAFRRVGLLAVVALLATAAVATSAQAVSISPDNTGIHGLATNSSLTYGPAFISCNTATADGNTTLDSDRISDLALTFTDNCAMAGVSPATVDCVGDVAFIAEDAVSDLGTVELNDGFRCDFTMAHCTLTVAGPQTTQSANLVLDEANDVLSTSVDFQATRTGSAMCGPPSGTASFSADYSMLPTDLTIDP
jgi:hypothetical protein